MVDTVEQALARLKEEGFQRVICQPTHIMHGFEYDGIVAAAAPFQKQFDQLIVGTPLLSAQEDYKQAVQTLEELVPREPGDALVLMGHGTGHPANACYAALEYAFHDAGYQNVFVGTVEGYPDLEAVKRRLRESGAQRVFLTPFMVVFGDHAANDMAGDEEDSWKKQLEKEGCRVHTAERLGGIPWHCKPVCAAYSSGSRTAGLKRRPKRLWPKDKPGLCGKSWQRLVVLKRYKRSKGLWHVQ